MPATQAQPAAARLAPSQWEGQIYYRFEELALFAQDGCSAGRLDGYATITFDEEGTWGVAGICLELDNGRCGDKARSITIDLPISDVRFGVINQILGDDYGASITEAVLTDLEENA